MGALVSRERARCDLLAQILDLSLQVGRDRILEVVDVMGEFFLLGLQTIRAMFRGHFPVRETLEQFHSIVVRSTRSWRAATRISSRCSTRRCRPTIRWSRSMPSRTATSAL